MLFLYFLEFNINLWSTPCVLDAKDTTMNKTLHIGHPCPHEAYFLV
jgi:hypothetical protein